MDFSLIGRGMRKISNSIEKQALSCPVVGEERKFPSFMFKPHSHLQWVVGVDISPMYMRGSENFI